MVLNYRSRFLLKSFLLANVSYFVKVGESTYLVKLCLQLGEIGPLKALHILLVWTLSFFCLYIRNVIKS